MCATLIAIPKLVNIETLPALLPPVVALLEHPHEVVRKKAVMALHRFYQLQVCFCMCLCMCACM